MKKLFTLVVCLMALLTVQAADGFKVYQKTGAMLYELTDGQTITVNTYENNIYTGNIEMTFEGVVISNTTLAANAMQTEVTRTSTTSSDEFCANQCVSMGSNTTITVPFGEMEANKQIGYYAHHNPTTTSLETVVYKFKTATESLTVTVDYDYQASGLKDTYASNAVYVTDGNIYWNFNNESERNLMLSDLTGKRLVTYSVHSAAGVLEASQLKKGVYILTVQEDGKAVLNRKLVVR